MLKSKGRNWLLALVSIFIASTAFAQNLQISGGNGHTVAICESGDIFAWGKNNRGQLGPSGPAGFSNTPVLVTGFPAGLDIKQTDAGSGSHTLALGCDGSVYAWGENGTGQLGNGSAGGFSATPVKVVGIGGTGFLTGVKYVSGGNDESFAIMNDGRVVSWGQNDKGQLGNNTTTDRNYPDYVRKCDGTPLTNVYQVEAGDENCYALLTDGSVWSWGDNADNGGAALGRNPAVNPHCAQQVVYGSTTDDGFTTNPVTNIISISAGDRHVLMLDGLGNVWSFGGDWGVGQLGQGKGYQKSAHRVLAPKAFNSPWTTDPYTIDGEYNTGPYLTGVTKISAGQAHSMAVLADGSIVTFGSNGFYDCGADCAYLSGQLGIGMTIGNKINAGDPGKGVEGPTWGLTGPGVKLQNVVDVSDGDAISIAILANGDVYIAGSNSYGQAGIGSGGSAAGDKSSVLYFQKITIPSCTFSAPCPLKPALGADFSKCPSASQTLYANVAPRPTYNYSWEYSATGTAPWTVLKTVTTFPTANADNLTVTTNGYYRVIISDDRASLPANCAPCSAAGDTIRITDPAANFGDPGNLTFCGTTSTVRVTETGTSATTTGSTYEWYAVPTVGTGTLLATTTDAGTASLNVTTLTKTGTAPNRVATVWVEDKSTFTATVATKAQIGAGGTQQTYGPDRINFIPIKSFSLNAVTVEWISYNSNPFVLTLYNAAGTLLATGTAPGPGNGNFTTTVTFTTPPMLAAGGSYYIVSSGQTRQYDNPGNAYTTNFQNAGVDILDIVSSAKADGTSTTTSAFAPFYNWNVTVGSPYPCGRLAVLIREDCPPCSKPTAVSITTPASTPVTICEGTAQNLIGSATVAAVAQNTNFTYSWIKTAGTATGVKVAPTVIAIPVSTPTATPAFALTGALTDAGTYTLRVEDGSAGSATCYTEASVVVVVNPTTVAGAVATSQTICTGENPAAFTVTTAASGGDGTYAYQWERSVNSGAYSDIANATNATYDEGVLTNATTTAVTYDYRRKVTSGVCPQVTSAAVRITVNPAVVAGVVAGDQTVCSPGDPVAFTQTTAATGGSGTYTYQWQSSTTSASTGFTNITNATNATYDAPAGLTATTYYRRVDGSGGCATVNTNAITVTVPAALVPGTVTANQTICYNTAPAAFTSTAAATGGNGTFAYQWQSSNTTGTGFANITNATNATYTETALLTADKYYRRQVTSGAVAPCNVAYTAEIRITVSPNFVVGSIGGTQTVCQTTGDPTVLTSASLPTGGQATYTYQWKSGTTAGGPYTNITNATNATYDPPAGLTATTYFVREDKSAGGCGTLTTNQITVTVTPTVVPSVTIATPSTTICTGTSVTFTATPTNGGTTPGYQWRKNGTNIASATNATYTTTGAANNDTYDVIMTSTAACPSPATATSNVITMSVTTVVTPAVTIAVSPGTTICAGASITFTATAGNGGTTPTYQWRRNGTNIASATNATYTTAAAANGDTYDVIMTSNSPCVVAPGTATSNVITMTVNPNVTPSVAIAVSPTGAICPNTSITFTATPTNGGTPTYQWQLGGTNITNATNATYTTTTVANNDSYRVVMTSNATCVSPATATSTPIVITVTPTPTPGVSIVADKSVICSGQTVVFTATPVQGGSTPTYVWRNNGSVISGQTTATLSISTLGTPNSITVEMVSNALCAPTTPAVSNAIVTTVNAGIGAGTIGNPQTICYNTVPAAINQLTAATGVTAAATYQWEASTDDVLYGPIPGATNTSYTPPVAITQDVYVRRVVTDATLPAPCNTATTPSVRITVRAQLVAGVIGSDETGICAGSVPQIMTQTTAPTGGTGTFTYQWQYADASTGGTFTNIANATNTSYTSTALNQDTQFHLVATSSGSTPSCGIVTTNVVSKTVSAPEVVTAVIDNAPSQVCITAGTIVFTANGSSTTGSGTLHYAWTLDNIPVGTDNPSYTYTISTADNGKVVKVVVSTSTACNTGTSSATYTLDIVSSITPTVVIATPNNPNCAGLLSTFTATPTNAGVGATYQWYVVPAGSPVGTQGNPVGAGLLTYSASNLANGDRVRVELTSTSGCLSGPNPFKSNEITMVIKPIPAPMIQETDQTVCSPASVTLHGTVGTGTNIQWKRDGVDIPGATNANYTATQAGSYTLYEDNGTCNSTSLASYLTIVQTPIANAGSDIYIKQGDAGNLNGSGGSTYSWSPATYLSSATVSNPSFTATQTITYTLTVSNTSGTTTCSTTDDVTVFVVSPIEVPNVITVNGDGSNDDWELKNIEGYPNCIIEIYNRWGNLVWKSEGYPKNWDGTNFRNGQVLPDGTYFYIINLQSQIYDEPLTGWVQIIK